MANGPSLSLRERAELVENIERVRAELRRRLAIARAEGDAPLVAELLDILEANQLPRPTGH